MNAPLLSGDRDTKVLSVLNISELHILTGISGKLISSMESAFEEKEDGQAFIDNFLKREDIRKCVYRGSNSFEGNQARKLLKCSDRLERDVRNMLSFETAVLPFVTTLQKLNEVLTACFGQSRD